MKIKSILFSALAVGFLGGILFAGIAMSLSAKYMMLTEVKSPYDYAKTVAMIQGNIPLQPGWHVVAVIDQQKEIAEHGGKPIAPFTIIKYCSGPVAGEMLAADDRKKLGAMMPKALAVYEKSDGQVYVSSANGAIMGKLFGGETERIIERVSLDVEKMLRFLNFKFSVF
jgi:uncharacterized protein (DUF302 family)